MNPMVAIIILNWNGWKDTIECLDSLYLTNYDNYEVVLVDNNSTDDSIGKIKNFCFNGSSFRLESPDNFIKVFEFEGEDFNSITPDLKIDKNTTKIFLLKILKIMDMPKETI
nr:glycosyltransferase [uncultured Methanobacterium sp.]